MISSGLVLHAVLHICGLIFVMLMWDCYDFLAVLQWALVNQQKQNLLQTKKNHLKQLYKNIGIIHRLFYIIICYCQFLNGNMCLFVSAIPSSGLASPQS